MTEFHKIYPVSSPDITVTCNSSFNRLLHDDDRPWRLAVSACPDRWKSPRLGTTTGSLLSHSSRILPASLGEDGFHFISRRRSISFHFPQKIDFISQAKIIFWRARAHNSFILHVGSHQVPVTLRLNWCFGLEVKVVGRANDMLIQMRNTFGSSDCKLLCINSAESGVKERERNPWLPYVASEEVFGPDQPIALKLLGSEKSFQAIEGKFATSQKRLLASTNQPSFLSLKDLAEEKKLNEDAQTQLLDSYNVKAAETVVVDQATSNNKP
ncbi:hypothetical protein H6P81_006725 [Aristolochia fimbriata]|uniref:Uncharacterized protein n=1 Tax=Aristolochia fimbriata TaxID=158543 RepID=A0AAV7F0V2_ARIFI|nr:hypothetical protein H6P81_006725 [Aristolochia fimbriata]